MLQQKKLISKKKFARRLVKYLIFCSILIIISLAIGIFGYHYLADLSWIDSFYNASMILTGMGPVNRLETDTAKMFSSFYALFSGIAFLTTVAIFISPIAHRILILLHLNDIED
ncbi:MAG: hypothetical protein ACK5B9_08840 [Flavobacteriia bacterium]|jgi:hypothetical protein